MLIPKPTNPEELYKFFAYGMPLSTANVHSYPLNCIRRKGWNVLVNSARDHWLLTMTYYSDWRHDKPEWILNTLKYR